VSKNFIFKSLRHILAVKFDCSFENLGIKAFSISLKEEKAVKIMLPLDIPIRLIDYFNQ
jgi:hypothetical protein